MVSAEGRTDRVIEGGGKFFQVFSLAPLNRSDFFSLFDDMI